MISTWAVRSQNARLQIKRVSTESLFSSMHECKKPVQVQADCAAPHAPDAGSRSYYEELTFLLSHEAYLSSGEEHRGLAAN
jgi:hypothetical protein